MKKIASFLMALVICVELLPITVLAKDTTAFDLYKNAVQAITSSGSWTEALTLTGDMAISKGKVKTKTKVTLEALMDIDNYSEEDVSQVQISGNVSMKVMNQTYAWNTEYENGVAHYEYTEPTQTSADIEMDPSYFNLNLLTDDMMEDAKITNNKITYTIDGDKIKEAGIAAVKLMPGIENLRYGDVDVEVMIDVSTGAIDTMEMKFQASMTYQGYDAEVDYIVDYQFMNHSTDSTSENQNTTQEQIGEVEKGLVVYSDYTNLSIRKGSTITLSAGIIIDGQQIADTSGITFWIDDPSVLESRSIGVSDNCRYVKLKGLSEGLTIVGFSDSNTGYSAEVPITVYADNYLSYTLSSVPTEYIDKYPTNIYNANGLYVDNYKYEVNDNQSANVSFDVYNTNYTYGVVEVFNADGEIQDAVLINKMTSSNTSIKTAVWDNVGYLIRDLFDGNFLTYRQETGYSKWTPVSVQIPKNGYIKISNDPENSFIVNLVNSADLLLSLGSLANEIKNFDIDSPDFAKELTLKLVQERAYANFVKDGSDMTKKLWKNVSKNALFSSESLGNFSNTIANNISKLKLEDIIIDTATDIGVGIGEELFAYFSGPIGKTLNGLFSLGKIENIVIQHSNLVNSAGVGSICIQNQGSGLRSSQQVTIESDRDFPESTSLNVFKVQIDSTILELIKNTNPILYESINQGTSYTYNISLLDHGKEVQPDGKVVVHMPIPDELKLFAYTGRTKIFRVGEDGQTTEMDVDIEKGCFVFETDHFSIYTIAGSNMFITIETILLIGTLVLISVTIFLTLVITLKRKKKKVKNNKKS